MHCLGRSGTGSGNLQGPLWLEASVDCVVLLVSKAEKFCEELGCASIERDQSSAISQALFLSIIGGRREPAVASGQRLGLCLRQLLCAQRLFPARDSPAHGTHALC